MSTSPPALTNPTSLFVLTVPVNRGGSGALTDPRKRDMVAALNLKAGKRAIAFADFNAAFRLFKHGVSFLPLDPWQPLHYDLSVQLFDSATEAGKSLRYSKDLYDQSRQFILTFVTACITNKSRAVAFYSDQLVTHAKCFDDKLNCE